MKNFPRISVIVPSYNKVKFINRTLRSIFNQKYPELEVIIQDGDSTDGSVAIIKKYVKKYPGIINWESNKDNGQLDAINRGMKKATGEILSFINADDVYTANAFDMIAIAYTSNPNALWFAGRGKVIDAKGREIAKPITTYKNLLLSLNSYFLILVTNYLMQPSVFITKKAYQKHGPFRGTKDFVMEYALWLKLAKKEMPVIVKQNLTKFRMDDSNKTKKLFKKILTEDQAIVNRSTASPLILILHRIHNMARSMLALYV